MMNRIFSSGKMLALFLVLMTAVPLSAQPSFVYEGRNWSPSNIICNIWNGVLIEGEYQDMTMAVVRTDGRHIYAGGSNSTFDILYTFRDNKLYVGESRFTSDVICTVSGTHIYRGDSNFALDLAYTYRDGYIFEGDGISMNDVVYTVDPPLDNMVDVAMLLVALDLL